MKSNNKILTGIAKVDEILASGISKDNIGIMGLSIGFGKSNFCDKVKLMQKLKNDNSTGSTDK